MESTMIWANFASENLSKTREFYTKLGFKTDEEHSSETIASFTIGDNNLIINFFKKDQVSDDINGFIGNWENQSEIIFSLSAKTKEEVDSWPERIIQAGGKIVSEPQKYKEGYTFCFADPDGHKFNVLYWPGM